MGGAHDPDDPASLPDDEIQSIIEDKAGDLWFATRGKGLVRFDEQTGEFTHFKHEPDDPTSLPQTSIWDLSILKDGRIAVIPSTSDIGLILFDPVTTTYEQQLVTETRAW